MTPPPMLKYPRTPHIEGSRQQEGDEDLSVIPFSKIQGLPLVVEEKVDGANSGISFGSDGEMFLQSRGHYLTSGRRERHFDLFKLWATTHKPALWNVLGDRYILYGEWLYAKHTIFYDHLSHYFMEFDVFDRKEGIFLDTPSRHALLATLPVVSVCVLKSACFETHDALTSLVGPSHFITPEHIDVMLRYCEQNGIYVDEATRQTDASLLMEGIYIKHEVNGQVVNRYKYVRGQFLQKAISSGSHWLDRPIVPNLLRYPLENIFLPELPDFQK